ncbi:MAG: succinate dehydrogenase iron-sulfur subunit [Thermoprotei archaeon]
MNAKHSEGDSTTFIIQRYDPDQGKVSKVKFTVELDKYSTVLDALIKIKETQDPTLSMRYSCRMGICGSCAMDINGKPRLACETNVSTLGTSEIKVSAMLGHPLLKDLVADLGEFFEKHRSVKPWLIRLDNAEKFKAEKEYSQNVDELYRYLPFSYCIKCGLCVDACPVSNTNKEFLGPQALSQVYRYISDSRDQGESERISIIDSPTGVWGCEFAGSCSVVCPKGVDPALAIQLLKVKTMNSWMRSRSGVADKSSTSA